MYIEPLAIVSVAMLASLIVNVGFFAHHMTRHTREP